MRSFWKFFMLLALVLIVPATFVGCGSSYMSEEEASRNEEEDDVGMQDADDGDEDDAGDADDE